jgi:hypothetical protein
MNRAISMTMRQALDLIGISDPGQLSVEAAGLAQTHPLRHLDELLTRCLHDIDNAERVMRTEIEALKRAADRETTCLDTGYATSDWPVHYAGKAEAGRQKIVGAFEQVNILAPLRQLLHTHTGAQPVPPAEPEPQAGAGT